MMPLVLKELGRIVKQIVGSGNMFEYRSTAANQLYLLYCFCGNVYFTSEIHRQVKYLWSLMVLCQIFITYYIAFVYVVHSRRKTLMMSLYVLSLVFILNVLQFGLPCLSYHYRQQIESMIEKVDAMFANRPSAVCEQPQINNTTTIDRVLKVKISIYVVCSLVRVFVCIFDVIVFNDDAKIANFLYYVYPLPKLDSVTNLSVFLAINGVSLVIRAFFDLQFCSVPAFISFWGVICSNQLISIQQQLETRSDHLNRNIGPGRQPSEEWTSAFRETLTQAVKNFQEITKLINQLRGFVEIYCSLLSITSSLFQIAQLYTLISTNSPYSVTMKGIAGSLSVLWSVFLLYWTGETLESSVSAVSKAVCSTPWHWSTRVRQDVYIFICQTQKFKNFTVINVYPMVYHTYMLYVRGVASFINVLHQITKN